MAKTSKIRGIENVLAKLHARRKAQTAACARGVLKACYQLQAWSMELVPVDKGKLKGSAFVTSLGSGLIGQVGYRTSYAVYVHEDLELRHGAEYNEWYGEEIAAGKKHSRGPRQQAKFLEQPLRQHKKDLADTIKKEAALP